MHFYLAPMDGYTDAAYRTICKLIFEKYNKKDLFTTVTEFMSADGFVRNPQGVLRHLLKTEIDSSSVAQIFGGKEDSLVETAIAIDKDYDYQAIELNIGCPSPKIVSGGGGSGMLKNKKRTVQIVKNISESIKKPFRIKTRIGLNDTDKQKQRDFILECAPYCECITLHARTFSHGNVGPVDRDFVYDIKKSVGENCKIIGNGGINSYELAIQRLGNLDGIMIGQSAIGNPWIFTEYKPSIEQVRESVLEHLALATGMEIYFAKQPFCEVDGKIVLKMPKDQEIQQILTDLDARKFEGNFFSAKEFRKHLFCYVKGLLGSKPFKQNVIWITNYYALVDEINRYFDEIKNRY